jgi:transcriptional regulator with GAF, ATPase, and Fis domain
MFLEDLYAAAFTFMEDLYLISPQEPDSLRKVVTHATELLNMPHGFLTLIDGSGQLEFKVGAGMFSRPRPEHRILAEPILTSRKAVVITDYAAYHAAQTGRPYEGLLRTAVVVPLTVYMKLLGVLTLAHDINSDNQITEDELVILSQYASLVSVMLTRIQTYQDLLQAI